jgi:hypothetical protein
VCLWVCVPQVRGEGVRGEGSVFVGVCAEGEGGGREG